VSKRDSSVVLLVSSTERHKSLIAYGEAHQRRIDGVGDFCGREKIHRIFFDDGEVVSDATKSNDFHDEILDSKGLCRFCARGICKSVSVRVFKLKKLRVKTKRDGWGQHISKASRRFRRRDPHGPLIREADPTLGQIEHERRELAEPPEDIKQRHRVLGVVSTGDMRAFCKSFDEVDAFIRLGKLELMEASKRAGADAKLNTVEEAAWNAAQTDVERMALQAKASRRAGIQAKKKLFSEWREIWRPQIEALATDPGRLRHSWRLVGKIMEFLNLEFRMKDSAWVVFDVEDRRKSVRELPRAPTHIIENGENVFERFDRIDFAPPDQRSRGTNWKKHDEEKRKHDEEKRSMQTNRS
jgi:hypothetical protein